MSTLKVNKINKILTHWPANAVYASSWLRKQGYSYELLKRYRKGGWLSSVGRGAVARVGDQVDWIGGVYAIQQQLELSIYIGGKTALELRGLAHFLPLGKGRQVYLFGRHPEKLPSWFEEHKWDVKPRYVFSRLFSSKTDVGFTDFKEGAFSVRIATPERAILEVLNFVPYEQSFEGAALLFEGLGTLRPQIVLELLNGCQSVKVKRLFLFLAEKNQHAWLERIDVKKINLGKGNRVIVPGGYFDPKYQITVPREYEKKNEESQP